MKTQKKENSVSVYQHFINCCEKLGIKDVVPFIDRMIVLDYIIANEDKHFNNFGILRNAEKDVICKPFKKTHKEQLKLVSSFEWINFESLYDVKELVFEVFSKEGVSDYVDEARIKAISDTMQKRIKDLYELSLDYIPLENVSIEGDV